MPTYRHTALPAYQSGREFDKELLDQLDLMPQLVEAMGFAAGEGGRLRGGRLPRGRRWRSRRRGAARRSSRAATATRSSSRASGRRSCSRRREVARWRGSGRPRCGSATASIRRRCPTSSRCAAIRRTRSPARAASGQDRRLAAGAVRQPRGGARRGPVRGRRRRRCGSTATWRRWTRRRRCRRWTTRSPRGAAPPRSRTSGVSAGSPDAWRRLSSS